MKTVGITPKRLLSRDSTREAGETSLEGEGGEGKVRVTTGVGCTVTHLSYVFYPYKTRTMVIYMGGLMWTLVTERG